MPDKKECFVIMPITTPDFLVTKYRDGLDHFKHVLDCLFIPGIIRAGFKAIPPKAKGSDLIQAEIIKNLETADIILCDISTLNPNVFFEFGIRTSLNKPVCVVKDELTQKIPFDTGILNHHEYSSTLEPWHLDEEINKIADHILSSVKRSKGENSMWKYFGFKSEAQPYTIESDGASKMDYLSMQLDAIRIKMDDLSLQDNQNSNSSRSSEPEPATNVFKFVDKIFPKKATLLATTNKENGFTIMYSGVLPDADKSDIFKHVYSKYGLDVNFEKVP